MSVTKVNLIPQQQDKKLQSLVYYQRAKIG